VRERLDMPAPDDEEIAESYQSPAQAEAPEDEGGPLGGGGGLFREARSLQSVPDNAVSISDRSEAPEGASVIEGPGGGLYYVPGGGGDGGDADTQSDVEQRVDEVLESDQADWKKRDELQDVTEEATGISSVRYDDFSPEQAADATRAFSALADADQTDGISGITSSLSEQTRGSNPNAALAYKPQRNSVEISPEFFSDEQAQEWADDNHLAGDSVNHLVSHEVGHHQHFEAHRNGDIDMAEVKEYEFTPQERNMVETELSDYAAASPLEFVAESYGVKATGGELSDLYEELGGAEPT